MAADQDRLFTPIACHSDNLHCLYPYQMFLAHASPAKLAYSQGSAALIARFTTT